MLEINSSKIDIDLLMEELDNIIDYLEKKPKRRSKNRKLKVENRYIYTVDDFTKYHDIEFLKNIYKKVLLRDIDQEGLESRLNFLRSGKRTKTEILSAIRFSKEGREKNIQILGIKKRFILSILNRIPIIGFFVKLFMLPRFIERVNRFEANYFLNLKEQDKKIESIKTTLQTRIDDIQASLDSSNLLIERVNNRISNINKSMEELSIKVDMLNEDLSELKRFKSSLLDIKKSISNILIEIKDNKIENIDIGSTLEKELNHYLDDLYVSFEDKFRGSRDDIKKRQSYYLPIVKSVIKKREEELIVDIGCGRGEWLELLRENGFRARGVDLNRLMVKESKALNLDVIEEDGIEFLRSLESNSISIVTGFHIVEHLHFETLIELFDESYRVLRDGGLIIFETPNPENIIVGSCTFYIDPTHKNPIPPVTLEFLIKNRGFRDIKIHRLHPIKEPSFIDILNGEDLNNLIFASTKAQDYSVIGYK